MSESHRHPLVISPHFDDAVLSCGELLAARPGARVCTVFAAPPTENMTTDWDRRAGFADAFEAIKARTEEDTRALAILQATPLRLPFCDAQYLAPPSHDALVSALRQTLTESEADMLMAPLGLFHADHMLTARACLALLIDTPGLAFYVYEDIPYRCIEGAVQARLTELSSLGYTVTPAEELQAPADRRAEREHMELKREAIGAYRSQLRAFGPNARASLFAQERYWQVRRKNA
jgi:LmbE family N-acetylglucosaminyl deacetylase